MYHVPRAQGYNTRDIAAVILKESAAVNGESRKERLSMSWQEPPVIFSSYINLYPKPYIHDHPRLGNTKQPITY